MADVQKTYALVIGAVLVLVGILGFFSNPLVGDAGAGALLGANTVENLLHIAGGALGIWLGTKGMAQAFNQWLGIVAAVIAVLGFLPATAAMLGTWFGINMAATVLHASIALVSLGVAYGVKQ